MILQPTYSWRKAPRHASAFSPQQLVTLFVWGARDWLAAAADVLGENKQALKGRPDETDMGELGGLKRSPAYL